MSRPGLARTGALDSATAVVALLVALLVALVSESARCDRRIPEGSERTAVNCSQWAPPLIQSFPGADETHLKFKFKFWGNPR